MQQPKLSPRIVDSGDGNQLFVYISMAIFDRHDRDGEIRRNVWNLFSQKTLGVTLEFLSTSSSSSSSQLSIQKSALNESSFLAWLALISAPKTMDMSKLIPSLTKMIMVNSMRGTVSPLVIVAPLITECYGVDIVLYDEKDCVSDHEWGPSRVWKPGNGYTSNHKCIHLLQREVSVPSSSSATKAATEFFELLVNSSSTHKREGIIPMQMVTVLPETYKQRRKISPHSERIITNASFFLSVFDRSKGKNTVIAPFVSPTTDLSDDIKYIHYVRVDARTSKESMSFVITGARDVNLHFFIYAVTVKNNLRYARPIGYWEPNYVDPIINITSTDDSIVIVPAESKQIASQRITKEYKCRVTDIRPADGHL